MEQCFATVPYRWHVVQTGVRKIGDAAECDVMSHGLRFNALTGLS